MRADARGVALVFGGIVSVQFGGALAVTLIPRVGVGGAVLMRLLFATVILLTLARPRWRGHSRAAWLRVLAFGTALGLMNWAFYGALAHLPIGVAVTVEFLGPLLLATALSRRGIDLVAVVAAGTGVLLISEALQRPLGELNWVGLLLAAAAGACWAAYIVTSGRVGQAFVKLDGLALAMVVASAIVVPVGLPSVAQWTGRDLGVGLGVALLSSVLPYSLELMALRRLHARVFGILLALEPAVAATAGLLVLGQTLSPAQTLGMALVVLASVIVMGLGARGSAPEDLDIAGA